tara:strand:+ start:23296 stop:23403 length:108 start_codon:yes stop_codon:yes gene_type:complete
MLEINRKKSIHKRVKKIKGTSQIVDSFINQDILGK